MDKPETSSATTSKSHQNQSSSQKQQHHHHQQQQQQNRPHRREFQSKTHSVNKRPVSKPFQRDCDVYVSNKSNFQAQMKQCQELLKTSESGEIYIHCLGSAINRGITLALKLIQESNNGLAYEANTSTIDLIDDLHPLNDEEDFSIQKRKNSSLHIKVYRQASNLNNKKPQN